MRIGKVIQTMNSTNTATSVALHLEKSVEQNGRIHASDGLFKFFSKDTFLPSEFQHLDATARAVVY